MNDSRDQKNRQIFVFLIIGLVIGLTAYLFWNTRGNLAFALSLRGIRIPVFFIVGTAISVATVTFQTITHNNILTPNIIGMDSMYLLFQTLTIFFFGSNHYLVQNSLLNFIISAGLMILGSLALYWLFFKKFPGKLLLLLMTGIVIGQMFNSLNIFFQAMIDPNEFETILSRSLVSFNQVEPSLIFLSTLILVPILYYFFKKSPVIDVFHLGENYATSLGIDVSRTYLKLFICISVLTAISTALVGPITFLGFLGANLAYQLFKTYKHKELFLGSSILTILMLLYGQLFLEHLFNNQTSINVIIEFVGGIYFLYMILKERERL